MTLKGSPSKRVRRTYIRAYCAALAAIEESATIPEALALIGTARVRQASIGRDDLKALGSSLQEAARIEGDPACRFRRDATTELGYEPPDATEAIEDD